MQALVKSMSSSRVYEKTLGRGVKRAASSSGRVYDKLIKLGENPSYSSDKGFRKCKCNEPAVLRKVVKESANKGRMYYVCAKSKCSYFIWAEDPKPPSLVDADFLRVLYTDGACKGNSDTATKTCPAGWGVVVLRRGDNGELELQHTLCGPVELSESSEHFLGATVASNNTAELSAIGEALRWVIDENDSAPVAICYDSEYAAKSVTGEFNGKKNTALISRVRALYDEVRRNRKVAFVKVLGHSGEKWNDMADLQANKGATGIRSQENIKQKDS